MKSFKSFFKKSNLPQDIYYHGSDDDNLKFTDKNHSVRSGRPEDMSSTGIFTSPNPHLAARYGKHLYSVKLSGNYKFIDDQKSHTKEAGSDDHISLISLKLNNAKNEGYDGAVLHNSLRPDIHHEVICFNPHKNAKVHKKIDKSILGKE